MTRVVGQRLPRVDALGKAQGTTRYTSDLTLPGLLLGKFLRSPHPHAVLRGIDPRRARRVPGVRAVLTHADAPPQRYNSSYRMPKDKKVLRFDQRVLDDRVRFVGDKVAAVAAESEDAALEALELIQVEFEPLPVVTDPEEALQAGAPEIHPGGNLAADPFVFAWGDVEQGFREADLVLEGRYELGTVQHANMENKSCLAAWGPDGRLTVWSATQVPFAVRHVLAMALGVSPQRVRVIAPPLGGGQGERSDMWDEDVCALLAKATGRPVRLSLSREEQFTSSRTRHGGVVCSKIGLKKDGTLVARSLKAVLNTGAYATMGARVAASFGVRTVALYRTPHVAYEGLLAYTNSPVAGGMRGFGSPQAGFVIETQLDEAAETLGIDPIELRMRNIVRKGDRYFNIDWKIHSCGVGEGLRALAERVGWTERRRRLPQESPNPLRRGIGVAIGNHISTVMPFFADFGEAILKLNEDGTVNLLSGVVDIGTGSSTILTQVVAEELGLCAEDVVVVTGDTDHTPLDMGSHSSRTTYVGGGAVLDAAKNLKRLILQEAAECLEAPAGEGVLENGGISVRGAPDRRITLKELAEALAFGKVPRQLIATGHVTPQNMAPPYSVCVAEVEVDIESGVIRPLRILEAIDCGRAINPASVEGQLEGAIAMGLGYALTEELVIDRTGAVVNGTLMDYKLPSAIDLPATETFIVDSEEPTGPFGAKGLGEASLVPIAPAIANAVAHATGVRLRSLPLRPEALVAGLKRIGPVRSPAPT